MADWKADTQFIVYFRNCNFDLGFVRIKFLLKNQCFCYITINNTKKAFRYCQSKEKYRTD